MVGQHLADLGAEVIKVEWYKRFDLYRTRGVERLRGTLPERVRRESSYSFQSLNRNKLGFAADLKREEGLELVKDLIVESDLLIENFTVGTLDRLGLGPEVLRELNDRLVQVSLSATGRGSSIESLRSYGLMLSALGGFESLVVDESGEFVGSPTFVISDPNAALFGVFAALVGLLRSRETGVGGTFECSQVEAVASLIDAHAGSMPATGMVEGIVATSDDQFVALSLPTGAAPVVDGSGPDVLRDWAAGLQLSEVISAAERLGGLATVVRDLADTERAPEFDADAVRQPTVHPVSGTQRVVSAPWLVDGQRPPIRRPAPTLGECNEYVLRSVLGRNEAEIAEIHSSGVVDESLGD